MAGRDSGLKGAKFRLCRVSKFWGTKGQQGDHSYHTPYYVLEICCKGTSLLFSQPPKWLNLVVANLSQCMHNVRTQCIYIKASHCMPCLYTMLISQ